MNMHKNNLILTAVTLATFNISAGPASAQLSWTYWQIPAGPTRIMENNLDKEIMQAYLFGLISPQERADLARDLDGIRVTEELYRASINGLNPLAQADVMARLEGFKARLANHMQSGQEVATTTVIKTR